MKVSEYIPFYRLLFNFVNFTVVEGKQITVNEMFENYPDFELTDIHIDQLDTFDLFSLQTVLKDKFFTPETIISYLRELFDNYRTSGGNPFEWLQKTFESINLNPQNYKAELRGILEKTLIEWIKNFEKQPYDLLYENENRQTLLCGYNYEPFLDIKNEYYIRLEEHKESFQSQFPFIDENDINTELALDDFLENEYYDLNIIFEQEYNLYSENSIYFYGCPFEIYLKTYPIRLKFFLEEFPDANEIDFCNYEINVDISYITSKSINDKIQYSIKKRIEFLKNKIEPKKTDLNNTSTIENQNPFPLVFTGAEVYKCFLEYKKHIIDFYTDYSYLKKRLEKLKLIHYHTDNDFMKFLQNELKFINQKEFENYSIKYESKLKSLSKSHSEQRENNFNNVFESLL
jgi:hypothetical protein